MLDAVRGQTRSIERALPPTARSCVREVDMRRSDAVPCLPELPAPCDINILLFEAQIKHRAASPAAYDALELEVRFCVRGEISPLLSNIYLHVLDVLWTRQSAPLGTLVRYADDFAVMCRTAKDCEQAEARIRVILERLGLELNPQKTRRVNLYNGKEGFDFLGCHLHKRLSGRLWEQKRQRLYFLQRWPSQRSMQRTCQRVRELTQRSRCHADIREVIANLNPILRGWGQYFRTGNAAIRFIQLDFYVWRRLLALRLARKGRHLQPGEALCWTREYFESLGLYRLRGTIRYPGSPFWESRIAAV